MEEILLFDLKDADGFSIDQKWENKQEGYMSSPIVIDGFCYIHLRKQRMTCIDLSNGANWDQRESFGKYQSMASNGKEILALDEDGTLYQIEANPESSLSRTSEPFRLPVLKLTWPSRATSSRPGTRGHRPLRVVI